MTDDRDLTGQLSRIERSVCALVGIASGAKTEVAERLEDAVLPPGTQRAVDDVLYTQAQGAQYRRAVAAAVERVAPGKVAAIADLDRPLEDWDLLLRRGDGEPVGVEIKWRNSPILEAELAEVLELTVKYSSTNLGLLIINQPIAAAVRYGERWFAASWRTPDDDDQLAAVVQALLERSAS